jgi:hypothetical protein
MERRRPSQPGTVRALVEGRASYPFTDEQMVGNIAVLAAVTRSVATGQTVAVSELG